MFSSQRGSVYQDRVPADIKFSFAVGATAEFGLTSLFNVFSFFSTRMSLVSREV